MFYIIAAIPIACSAVAVYDMRKETNPIWVGTILFLNGMYISFLITAHFFTLGLK